MIGSDHRQCGSTIAVPGEGFRAPSARFLLLGLLLRRP